MGEAGGEMLVMWDAHRQHRLAHSTLCAWPSVRMHAGVQIVKELVACHNNNPMMKFLGQCSDVKAELDACFRVP